MAGDVCTRECVCLCGGGPRRLLTDVCVVPPGHWAEINEPHEGKRKAESIWPIHQINWQRSRYIWEMYNRYKMVTREVYDYCVEQVRARVWVCVCV